MKLNFLTSIVVAGLFFASSAFAADATFSWEPNVETDLAGYEIHYGSTEGEYSEIYDCGMGEIVDNRVTCEIVNIPDTITYYACVAYDESAQKSDYSNVVISNPGPANPKNLQINVIVNITIQ